MGGRLQCLDNDPFFDLCIKEWSLVLNFSLDCIIWFAHCHCKTKLLISSLANSATRTCDTVSEHGFYSTIGVYMLIGQKESLLLLFCCCLCKYICTYTEKEIFAQLSDEFSFTTNPMIPCLYRYNHIL
jgi:hypothetical protein